MSRFFEALAWQLPRAELRFLNYGFAPPDGDDSWIDVQDRCDKYHLALIRHLTAGADLRGKTVLEVGCGRGGNCYFLARYCGAREVIALDLCESNLALAGAALEGLPAVRVCGDAQALPVKDTSVDAVVNVESSHRYADFAAFLNECRRILKPGGLFFYTDFWCLDLFPYDWPARERALADAPFELLRDEDITEQVFRALKADDGLSATLLGLADERNREWIEGVVETNVAMRWALASGRSQYRCMTLKKPF